MAFKGCPWGKPVSECPCNPEGKVDNDATLTALGERMAEAAKIVTEGAIETRGDGTQVDEDDLDALRAALSAYREFKKTGGLG